jgi:hypothetical protein
MAAIILNNAAVITINPTNEILPVKTGPNTFSDSKFFDRATARGIQNFTGIDNILIDDSNGFLELGQNGSAANILLDELNQNIKIGNFSTPADSPAINVDAINTRIEIKGTNTILDPGFTPNPSQYYLKIFSTDLNQYYYIHLERQ